MYHAQINRVLENGLDYTTFKDKTVLITGGTGLLGSVLADTLCTVSEQKRLNIKIVLVSRSKRKFEERFSDRGNIQFIEHDMSKPFSIDFKVDFIIHLAANTHPKAYSAFPVETMTTNFLGILNLLDVCRMNNGCRILNISSVEIYGENKSDKLRFNELDCGYIDCNTVRAGYNESKRASESLCQAYNKQFGVDFVTARLCRCYGPTLQKDDSKALSQFIFKGLTGEKIILKSAGNQLFSYIDVFSAVSALFYILLKGVSCEAYNIADEESDIRLRDLAEMIANICGTSIIFDLPDEEEAAGFSKASVALLDSSKLKQLGWSPFFNIKEGLEETIKILKEDK